MKKLEVLLGEGILVSLAQKSNVIAVLELLEAHRIPSEFLVILTDGPRVLYPAVDEFFFPIAFYLLRELGKNSCQEDGCNGCHEHQRQQDVAALLPIFGETVSSESRRYSHRVLQITKLQNYQITNETLSLCQWDALAIVVQDVLNFHRICANVEHLVAPVDDVAFGRDEDVLPSRQKHFLGLAGLAGKSEELQVDGGRWRRLRRKGGNLSLLFHRRSDYPRYVDLRPENVSPFARVLRFFARPQEPELQSRVK